jgi:hypothetical protein
MSASIPPLANQKLESGYLDSMLQFPLWYGLAVPTRDRVE